jgi:mRNA-degrading endonuclease RelE of RelBE toxin-antitoxin system
VTAEPWAIEFERRADKDLERLDPQVKQRVLSSIGRLAAEPRRADLRRLKGRAESVFGSAIGA